MKTITIALLAAAAAACAPSTPRLGESSIDDVVAAMTLEEKAHLVVGTGMAGHTGDTP